VFNYGRGRPADSVYGRARRPADAVFHLQAAARSLAAGETFYTYQRGLPEVRAALARYHAAPRRDFDRNASSSPARA